MSAIPIYQVLNALSPSISELGSPIRVYPGVIPQSVNIPLSGGAVTYNLVSGHPEDYIDAPATMDSLIVTVNCWALTDTVCSTIAAQVRTALEQGGKNCIVRFNPDTFEPDTQRYGFSFDIEFWLTR